MTRYEVREKFKKSGLSYSNITPKDIALLSEQIKETLKKWNKKEDFKMRLIMVRNCDRSYSKGYTSINYYFFRVNGNYFRGREAISFNSDRFIGFAGWASSKNVQPFLEAFSIWLDLLIKNKQQEKFTNF